jgi:hypothetical protein
MAAVLVWLPRVPETVPAATGRLRLRVRGAGIARFRRVVAPMAPWVFAAPAIAFALLPAVVGADHLRLGIAVGGAITSITAFSGVLVQPAARRIERHRPGRTAVFGLGVMTAGLALGAVTAAADQPWLLLPSAVVLGSAYGVCLVAGLADVQQLASPGELAGLTAVYYAITYLGFAAPTVLAFAASWASYAALLALTAALALLTAGAVGRASAQLPR